MAISKVEYNGEVLMDLTKDTVTEETLASGVTAHNAAGNPIIGKMVGGVQSDWAQTDETQLDYIKNKPGDLVATENTIELLNVSALPTAEEAGEGIYDTYFEHQLIQPTIGDVVQVEIKLLNSENSIIFNNVKVLSYDEGDPLIVVNTNQTDIYTAIEEGLVKIDDSLPAFFLCLFDNAVDLISWEDYTGASIVISKTEVINDYIKLPNEALTFDDMPISGSEKLITSGGVYEAIENGKEIVYIPAELGFNESGVLTTATLVGVTHADILEYIEQGKEPKLKVFSEAIGLQSGLFSLVFHTIDDSLMFQLTMATEPYLIINIIVTQNATTLQTVQNLNSGSIVDASVEDITKGWDEYVPTVGAAKKLISIMTDKTLKPFEVVATVDFQNNTLINVEANGQSQTDADIYQLIKTAYDNDYHCYISGDLSQVYYGYIGLLQLTILSSSIAVFEQVINIDNKYYHMRAVIMPDNVFAFTATELINQEQIFAEMQRIEEIANGKCQSFVFDTQLKLETEIENYKNNELSEGDILYNIELKIGDIFLIKDTEVPDYWWNGNGISELETTKIDLTNYAKTTDIPTKTSQLTNDSGFATEASVDTKLETKQDKLTSYVESVNGQSGNVTLNAADVGALPATTVIPPSYEPFYIDCTFTQNGNIFSASVTSDTPTHAEVDTAFAQKRPIYLRWEAAGIYISLIARTPDGIGGYAYTFIIILGDTTSTIQFFNGGFNNTSFVAQEKIAVVSSESDVEEGKITIVV